MRPPALLSVAFSTMLALSPVAAWAQGQVDEPDPDPPPPLDPEPSTPEPNTYPQPVTPYSPTYPHGQQFPPGQPGYPQPGYPQPGYPQPGYPQPGYPQPGYPQPGYPQPGYPQPGYVPPGCQVPPGYPPPAGCAPAYPQPGYPQPGYVPPGCQVPPGYAPPPGCPPAYPAGPPGEAESGRIPKHPKPGSPSGEHRWDAHLLEYVTFGIGFLGGAGASFIDQPTDQSVGGLTPVEPVYPGFAGLTTSIGPTFELRILGYFGIELGIMVHKDRGSADLRATQTAPGQPTVTGTWEVEIAHDAVHVPLLFKGTIPGRYVTPMLFLGPEFVLPDEASAEIIGDIPAFHATRYGARVPDSYTNFMIGVGLEVNLPIPYVDFRIPLTLRGSFNPGIPDRREELADHIGTPPNGLTEVIFVTEFEFQVLGNIGLALHF